MSIIPKAIVARPFLQVYNHMYSVQAEEEIQRYEQQIRSELSENVSTLSLSENEKAN